MPNWCPERLYVLLHFLISMQLKENVTGIMCVFILYMNLFQIFINNFYFTVCEFTYIFQLWWASLLLGKEKDRLLIFFFFFNEEWFCLVCFSGHVFTLFYSFVLPDSTPQSKSLSGRKPVRFYIVEGMHSRGWSR